MLRAKWENGWWLITHPDHARLAGAFAAAWGNEAFRRPEPRDRVLFGIASHDDGWMLRDAHPTITRQGLPSAFSSELVGKYAAFEEIDIADYLAVRDRAVRVIADRDAYAALLISMHTYSLLTEHADRSTIEPHGLVLLDEFLAQQRRFQEELMERITVDPDFTPGQTGPILIQEHFKLLQACDNLSLLSCVDFDRPANLLHVLPLNNGGSAEVAVAWVASRCFRLTPWPFSEPEITFQFPARRITGYVFDSSHTLDKAFHAAAQQELTVKLIA
jgi:Protein of unknown function (DUF3891)